MEFPILIAQRNVAGLAPGESFLGLSTLKPKKSAFRAGNCGGCYSYTATPHYLDIMYDSPRPDLYTEYRVVS